MKRGLVVRDRSEVSDGEWEGRVASLQTLMATEGLDLVLVYGDVFRSDDIGYLTNLCIYWNEGVVAVPATGEIAFLTKLSPRVHTWMRKVSTVTDLRSGKNFGELVNGLLADQKPGVVGLVDADLWPQSILDDVRANVADWELRLLGPVVRDQRAIPSPAELKLLRRGARILADAAERASEPGLAAHERVAALERLMRGGGFTDLMIETRCCGNDAVSLQVTGEYRHGWLHASRIVAEGSQAPWIRDLRESLRSAIEASRAGTSASALQTAAEHKLVDLPDGSSWDLCCVNQADLATNGELQSVDHEASFLPGSVMVISVELVVPGLAHASVAETVLLTEDGAEPLTTSEAATRDPEERLTA